MPTIASLRNRPTWINPKTRVGRVIDAWQESTSRQSFRAEINPGAYNVHYREVCSEG